MTLTVPDLYKMLKTPTKDLRPTRSRFATFYDDWITDRRPQGAPAGFIHAVVSAHAACSHLRPPPDPADNGDAMRLAVAALADETNAFACLSAALGTGLFDVSAGLQPRPSFHKKIAKKLLKALQGDGPRALLQATATTEAVTDDDEFWTDLGHLLPAVMFARRRLCLIKTIGPDNQGSGFLVGPSVVLTNLHVVDGLPQTLSKRRLTVKFDYSETTALKNDEASEYSVADAWLLDKGALGDKVRAEQGDDYWWNDFDAREAFMADVEHTPDYALLRLDGAPGLQRGWYDLTKAKRAEPTGVWALHHPSGNDQTITRGFVREKNGSGAARLFHSASTTGGSSGGLILDQDGEPAALHYLGLSATVKDTDQDNHEINLAIPLHKIAKRLEDAGLLEELAKPGQIAPFRGCIDGAKPVFGRKGFLRDLNDLWAGDKRIMRIFVDEANGPIRKPGKSFSAEVICALFSGAEHHHILFGAGDIKVDAFRVAQDAVGSFAEDLVDDIPARPATTSPAYVKTLVDFFATAIEDRLSNKNVWVILDDLDRHDLSDASGREFLAALYAQVDQLPNLRVILIGLDDTITVGGMTPEDFISSEITQKELDALNKNLADWILERGFHNIGITPETSEVIADLLVSFAGDSPTMMDLSGVVTDHVAGIADARIGAAKLPEAGE